MKYWLCWWVLYVTGGQGKNFNSITRLILLNSSQFRSKIPRPPAKIRLRTLRWKVCKVVFVIGLDRHRSCSEVWSFWSIQRTNAIFWMTLVFIRPSWPFALHCLACRYLFTHSLPFVWLNDMNLAVQYDDGNDGCYMAFCLLINAVVDVIYCPTWQYLLLFIGSLH